MLVVESISTYYESSRALFGVSLKVTKGEVVCLLGRNGAGKTTTLRSIMGLTPPSSGNIRFKDIDIHGNKPYQLAQMGMGFVPEDRRVFADLTVEENLEVGAYKSSGVNNSWTKDRIYRLFPLLKNLANRKAGFLSGGEQQMLSIARALMGNPELLLLDEPTEGLAPLVVQELEDQILQLKNEGISILLAEQNLKSALKLADRGYIIDTGRICYESDAEELRSNSQIREKYLLV